MESYPKFCYPNARRQDYVKDDYHGTVVLDPYRWLEDLNSKETGDFVAAQNNLTADYLEGCAIRREIHEVLSALTNFPIYSCPSKKGSNYFFFQSSEFKVNNAIYSRERLTDEPVLFQDLNKLTSNGKLVLDFTARSNDGLIFAYGLSKLDSDWVTIHFKDVLTGKMYEQDILEKVKFSAISWSPDSQGVFYAWYPDQISKTDECTLNLNHKVSYHRMGTPQCDDVVVIEFPDTPSRMIGASVSDCGKYLVVTSASDREETLTYFAELKPHIKFRFKTKPELIPVIGPGHAPAEFKYITNDGPIIYFLTNKRSPRVRLITVNLNFPHQSSWKTIIPEHGKHVMQWVAPVNNTYAFACYISKDLGSILNLHRLSDGALLQHFPLEIGTITGYSGTRSSTEFFFQFQSFFVPGTVYHVDFKHKDQKFPKVCCSLRTKYKVKEIQNYGTLPKPLELIEDNFKCSQVFCTSKDGTKIPLFILHNRDFQKTGDAPCFLYVSGAFGSSVEPLFHSVNTMITQNMGAVVGIANIRGGKEHGPNWHEAGRLLKTQKSIDDFIKAAEYMIKKKYTCAKKIAINAGRKGGLLIGACCNQRPDLFGAAIPELGIMDMLRFHSFGAGSVWCADYGCSTDRKQFKCLLKYSPLHNVMEPKDKKTQYPAILCLSIDYDPFVVPAHALKYIARLQHVIGKSQYQKNPLLAILESQGTESNERLSILRETDKLVFVIHSLGLEFNFNC